MKKIAMILYSAAFFGMCCIPLVAMPFAKGSGEIEKKTLSEKPSVVEKGKLNPYFSEEFDKWYNERLPFRTQLLTAANFIKSECLHSPSANVITGSDGWLFYESTADDFMDTNPLTEQELKNIAVTLSLIQENVNDKGGNFTFAAMPDKNTVYGEYMPKCYKKSEENNLTRLYSVLDGYGVHYVNMRKLMIENKELGLYHKRDTHWNYLGALLGYNAIMDSLGKEHKTYEASEYIIKNNWQGDLDKLLYPNGGFLDEQYYFDIEYDDFRFTMPVGVTDTKAQLENFMSDKEENDNRFRTVKTLPADGSKLYMVRDSFGRALLPFMIDNYDTAMFVRTNCPEMTMAGPGTDMIYEIVERNLPDLIKTAPFMTAPKRDIYAVEEKSFDGNKVYTSNEAYGYRIYGKLDEDFLSDDGRIYVHLENSEHSYTFEAFPILETKLMGTEADGCDHGFSMILDSSAVEQGEYSVSLISGEIGSGILDNITLMGV